MSHLSLRIWCTATHKWEAVRMLTNPELMSLDELARRIRAFQEATQAATSNALGRADAGDALLAARRRISAGWGRWLVDNCGMGVSTAELYMQLARHREKIEVEIERVGELSLRAARRFIAKPRATTLSKPKALKTKAGETDDRMSAILRKALSLIKTANAPGTSSPVAESNKNEAIAALQQLEPCEFGVQLCPKDPSLASRLGNTCRASFHPK